MEAVEVVFWVVVSGEALFERGWTGPSAGWQLQSWQTAWGGQGRERKGEREREFQLCLQKASRLVIPSFTQRYLFLLFPPGSFPGPCLHFLESGKSICLLRKDLIAVGLCTAHLDGEDLL